MSHSLNAGIWPALESIHLILYIGILVVVKIAWKYLGRKVYFEMTRESFLDNALRG